MADTALLDRPAPSTGSAADVLHIVCCDDDTALCGQDVSGEEWSSKGPVCVLCDLEWKLGPPCPAAACARRGPSS